MSDQKFVFYLIFFYLQQWTNPIIEADGTTVDPLTEPASIKAGQTWSFTGAVYSKIDGDKVGYNYELCTRLNDGDIWHCEGTYEDLYGCSGQLAFEGPYADGTLTGKFTIVGGTGDFEGAFGYIDDKFTYARDNYYAFRTIYVQ